MGMECPSSAHVMLTIWRSIASCRRFWEYLADGDDRNEEYRYVLRLVVCGEFFASNIELHVYNSFFMSLKRMGFMLSYANCQAQMKI